MSLYGGIEDHPDLQGDEWARRVEREFYRERRGKRGFVVTLLVSLAVTTLVAGGLYAGGVFDGPPAAAPPAVDLARPFAGTSFESWADGEKGVVAAPEHEQVRRAVIAARLDPAVLEKHDASAFLALTPAQAHEAWKPQLGMMTTQLKPGTKLLPNGIKTQGTITNAVDENGNNVVRTDFQFAYAFAPDDPGAIRSHEDFIVLLRAVADFQQMPYGLRFMTTTIRIDHAACTTERERLLAPRFLDAKQPC